MAAARWASGWRTGAWPGKWAGTAPSPAGAGRATLKRRPGAWRPGKAVLGAILFAAFDALQIRLQQTPVGAVVPYQLFLMLPYVFSILALIVMSRRATVPAALMVGFHAQALPLEPSVGDELEQARWFSVADLDAAVASGEVQLSPRMSIARWLIDEWMEQARGREGDGFQPVG